MKALHLRQQLALAFAGAVALTLLLFSLGVVLVLRIDEQLEARAGTHTSDTDADGDEDASRILLAMAAAAPVAILLAGLGGWWLAGRAVGPMQEASARARAARSGAGPLQLPVRGRGDEWDQLAGTLNLLLAEQRDALERVRRFTADAAHELRTPLTTIIGEADTILRRERTAAELRESLGVVREEGVRLARLVEGLLLLARADARTLVTRREAVELLGLSQRLVTRMMARTAQEYPRAELTATGEAIVTSADAVLLERVVENLLDNALRHGGTRATVEVSAEPGWAVIRVRDDGPGIPPAIASTLFERFVRGDEARSGAGTGLGLPIARAVTEAHGGTLDLEPSEQGTRFVLRLPRASSV